MNVSPETRQAQAQAEAVRARAAAVFIAAVLAGAPERELVRLGDRHAAAYSHCIRLSVQHRVRLNFGSGYAPVPVRPSRVFVPDCFPEVA